ncbi:hypothetical protein D3C76_1689830 [compost metagenome]
MSRCRNPLFGDLDVLFKQSKSFILELRVVVLIQPPDDFDLSLLIHVEITFGDIMHQMINNAFLIRERHVEQQLGIVARLLK